MGAEAAERKAVEGLRETADRTKLLGVTDSSGAMASSALGVGAAAGSLARSGRLPTPWKTPWQFRA